MATHILVAGRVQGVGYRYAFADRATELGLAGWVRNRRDGTVEACVDGPAPAIDQIVAWARIGPAAARVDAVRVNDVQPNEVRLGESQRSETQRSGMELRGVPVSPAEAGLAGTLFRIAPTV